MGRPSLALLIALSALLVLAGCAQSRSASTQSWSGVAVSEDAVFVGTKNGQIIQLTAGAGLAQVAPFQAPESDQGQGYPAIYGTPSITGGRVFAGTYNGLVLSVAAQDLRDPKTFEIDGNDLAKGIAGSLVPFGKSLIVPATEDAEQGRLYVLNTATLEESCRYPARNENPVGQIWTTPLVHNGIAYFGDLNHEVHAVSISDCRAAWDRPAQLGGAIVATPTIVGGKLYVGAFDRVLYEVDLYSGSVSPLFEGGSWFWSGIATDESRLYVPNMDGEVYAYDLASRRVVWQYPGDGSGEPILATPVVVDGQLAYASDSGMMVVLRARDGAMQWERRVGNEVRAPLTHHGNLVFLHSLDETVSAVDLVEKRLMWDQDLDDVR